VPQKSGVVDLDRAELPLFFASFFSREGKEVSITYRTALKWGLETETD
jgi:hypothetical protein